MLALLGLLVSLCVSLVQAKYKYDFSKATKDASTLEPSYVTLPVDHFNKDSATFQNRYWVQDEFYKEGGPVFFFDVGETDASQYVPVLFYGQGVDQLPDYAQRFGALLILWEHRFYGDSFPAGSEYVETTEELANYYRYLTFEQAMEDVAVFAKGFNLSTYTNQDLRPNNVPWVFMGGSYPGLRAAYMRVRNPEVVFASYASSAPVQLQEDFWQYYVAAERKLSDTSDTGCLNDMHAIANYINNILVTRNTTAAESLLYNAGLSSSISLGDSDEAWSEIRVYLEEIAEVPPGDFQDYGLEGGLGQFCEALISPEFTNDTEVSSSQLKDGIVAHYGLNRAVEIYGQVVAYVGAEEYGSSYTASRRSLLTKRLSKTGLGRRDDNYASVSDEYSWLWQTCTEAGFFQDSNTAYSTNILPGFVNVTNWIEDKCITNYGNSTSGGPDVSILNSKYGGWHINPTNVFFINGQYDPWRALGVASDIDPATPGNKITNTIPAAGETLPNGTVFGYTIENGVHCSDLSYNLTAAKTNTTYPDTPDASAHVAHELFASALSSWLPAYTKFAAASQTPSYTATFTATATGPGNSLVTGTGIPSNPNLKSAGAREIAVGSAWALTVLALGMAFLA